MNSLDIPPANPGLYVVDRGPRGPAYSVWDGAEWKLTHRDMHAAATIGRHHRSGDMYASWAVGWRELNEDEVAQLAIIELEKS